MLMGARTASPVRAPAAALSNLKSFTDVGLVLLLFCAAISSTIADDAGALLKFRNSLNNGVVALSSWDSDINPKPPCTGNHPNWVGVICWHNNVWGLRLENMGLHGKIDVNSLVGMRYFRVLSLMNNTFVGSMPDIKVLKGLKAIFLSYNHFSGEIPDDMFSGMYRLKQMHLANNEFTGKMPSSLTTLRNLMVLRLDSNKFEGRIPDFPKRPTLRRVNLSNNNLEGPIPLNLSVFEASAFRGNADLCGFPLNPCVDINKDEAVESNYRESSLIVKIILIIILIAVIIALIAGAFIIMGLVRSKKKRQHSNRDCNQNGVMSAGFQSQRSLNKNSNPAYIKTASKSNQLHQKSLPADQSRHAGAAAKHKGEQGRLLFLRDDRRTFDLHDLLKASAEILGSAAFGSSYKAVILDGQESIVVKRYKQMNNVGREDFNEHMRRLGNLNHRNLLPLIAYYYRREEKLLLTDYVENGCLASHLHGNHNFEKPGLNWATRLKIVKGVARGLAHLYNSLPSVVAPHGHLKSSNILLDASYEPLLTDYGLIPVTNLDHAQKLMMPYKSPEYAQLGRITKKTDVWSFGILILEIITGKFPENYLTEKHNDKSDIASWVNNMITEKRTSEVFDIEMGGVGNSKGELLKLLKIGLTCCEETVERRLDIKEALQQIEELKEAEDEANEDFAASVPSNDRDANFY